MDLTKNNSPKKEAKRKDPVTAELQKGFEWTQNHSKALGAAVLLILVAGATWTGMSSYSVRQEKKLQSEFSVLDFAVVKQKEVFERGKNPPPAPKKAEDGTTPVPLPSAKATGDLAKDFGKPVGDLESFLAKNPNSSAGAMAALRLSGLYSEYSKPEDSLKALEKVKYDKGILGSLVKMELGTQLANNGKCPEAEKIWSQLAGSSKDTFLKGEVRLKQGLCAESRGELAQAEQFYRESIDLGAETETGKSAQKYLRLLKFKGQPDVKTQ
jgi:predicted negative regulator of RcsB-dependent stress response